MMSTFEEPPISLRLLLAVTRMIPPLPHSSGLSNRFLKRLWPNHGTKYLLPIWDEIRMVVDPCDATGGNLAFIPQLFDRRERDAIRRLLPRGGTFVDVGSNIGAYALWAARQVGPSGKVLAYEAEPANYAVLKGNVELNGFAQVDVKWVGVSSKREMLKLRVNADNSGGHTFAEGTSIRHSSTEIDVQCQPLAELLSEAGVAKVDFMKLDIEGFEYTVLSQFFSDAPKGSKLRPNHVLLEVVHVDRSGTNLTDLMRREGYECLWKANGNALFANRS